MLFGWPKHLCVKNFHFRTFRAVFRAKPTVRKSLVGLEADWFYLKTDKRDIFKTPATECRHKKKKEWGEKKKI